MNTKNIHIKSTATYVLAISLFISPNLLKADDTEVFLNSDANPNLLFLMDLSASMNWGINATGYNSKSGKIDVGNPPSRSDVMKNALRRVLIQAPDNINIGVMNYGPGGFDGDASRLFWKEEYRSHSVGGITFPVSNIDGLAQPIINNTMNLDNLPNPDSDITVRNYIADIVESWEPYGGTPIVDSLVEAARYFSGDKMYFGYDVPSGPRGSHPSTHEGPVVLSNLLTTPRPSNFSEIPNYISPISNGCQANFIALLSDGEPTNYYPDQTKVVRDRRGSYLTTTNEWGKGLPPFVHYMQGDSRYGTLATGVTECTESPSGFKAGTCGPEIAKYMATKDMHSGIAGDQTIKMFTVGYSRSVDTDTQKYLQSMVTVDDNPDTPWEEGYYSADNAQKLKKALFDIIEEVAKSSETLGSPSYSVNVQNGLEHEDHIYIPIFKKSNTARWSGNLKKFNLVNTSISGKDVKIIQGKNNQNAFDEQGAFTDEAIDLWSESPDSDPDGGDLERGGVANLLVPKNRKLFSNITCSVGVCDLNTADNELSTANKNITNALLDPNGEYGVKKSSDRSELINFIRGENPDNSERFHMGDMLHSEPLVVTYSKKSDTTAKKQYVFVGTNEGYLHAFDTSTGKEMFAFMPKKLLQNIAPQFQNKHDDEHIYGVDGAISYWQDEETEKRYLYFGMRRGGTSFYAMDVTDINQPKLLWVKSAEDYPTLGQSWSPPYLGYVGVGSTGEKKEAMIISGGYDPVEDRDYRGQSNQLESSSKVVNTTLGKDVLVLDAKTGEKLWSLKDKIGNQALSSSIPGGLKALDTNNNRTIDRLYFADSAGDVWRLDLSEVIGSSDATSKLTKFASLGGSGVNARKFYTEPDVSIMRDKGNLIYVISIGSGFRAHPMDKKINDKFFILVDDLPFREISEGFELIKTSDLAIIDITNTATSASLTTTGDFNSEGKRGWMVNLPSEGEKVLTTAFTREGVVVFTTFTPDLETAVQSCGVVDGSVSRLYALNIATGKAGIDFTSTTRTEIGEPTVVLSESVSPRLSGPGYLGIIPPPEVVFGAFELDEEGVCKHPVDYRLARKLSPVAGFAACQLEPVYWSGAKKN